MSLFDRCLRELRTTIAVSMWVTSMCLAALLLLSALLLPFLFPSAWAYTYTAVVAVFTFFPLEWSTMGFIDRLLTLFIQDAVAYFPLRVKLSDPAALDPKQSYLIGFEPHSVLPVALPIVFSDHSPVRPPQLEGVHGVASNICFQFPLVRHLFWWLGIRPASRSSIVRLLKSGKSVVLVPGGVREIQHMEPQKEVLFLKQRLGFVKLAVQQGRPLLPVFAFNQTPTYTAATFGLPQSFLDFLGRRMGAQPMWMMGRFGTTIPKKSPILVVIGTPIPVPQNSKPDLQTMQSLLDQFIRQMEQIFEQNKNEAGVKNTQLCII